jgi:transcriptional regulator with XRE-family HTH domain
LVSIGDRLKEERQRIGMNQSDFAALAQTTKKSQIEYEKSATSPNAAYLAAVAPAGVDVQYVVTGVRQGHGIGESAVYQSVLDAVDLLSLAKKVDADQLARAVVKLCARNQPASSSGSQVVHQGQQFNAPVNGGVAGRDIVKKGAKKNSQ